MSGVFSALTDKIHPLALGNIMRQHTLIRYMVRRLLLMHLGDDAEEGQVDNLVETMTEKLYSHDYLITRDEAERIGLVHKAVEPEQLLTAVLELASELADRPPLSLALIKRCVLQGTELPLIDGLRLEQDAFLQTMRSDDASRLMRRYQQEDVPLDER